MKKLDWFILIIVIIAIVAIGIWAFMSSEGEDSNEEKKSSKFESISKRLKAIQQQINHEIESLRLTTEMEQFLEKKIGRIFLVAKTIFLAIFLGTFYLFIYNGSDYLTGLFNTMGIIGFIGVATSFLFLSRVPDVNTLVELVKNKIRMWIYEKYEYNPEMMSLLKESIEVKTIEADELKEKMRPNI